MCLTKRPYPLPKRVLHRERYNASSFNFKYRLIFLRSSSSCLRLLPYLPFTRIPPSIFHSITCFRKHFLRNMLPNQIYFIQFVACLLLWRYSPTWALASSVLHLQTSLSSADFLQFLRFNILLTSVSTVSIRLPLGLPTVLLPTVYPFSAFFGALLLFIICRISCHMSYRNTDFSGSKSTISR